MNLTPPDLLTPPEKSLRVYLEKNHHRPEFAVARRQQWPKLLAMLNKVLDKLLEVHLAFKRQRFVAAGLYMAGTGAITDAQIDSSELMSAEEKRQCKELRATYLLAYPTLPDTVTAHGEPEQKADSAGA